MFPPPLPYSPMGMEASVTNSKITPQTDQFHYHGRAIGITTTALNPIQSAIGRANQLGGIWISDHKLGQSI